MSPRRLLVLALLVALTTSGCSLFGYRPKLDAAPLPMGPDHAAPVGLERFYDQKLSWHPCRESFECTEVEVPLDYADPGGGSITLSVLKVPAEVESQRLGYLLVNPGGPGGSGVDYAANAETYFGQELRAAYDIVGFDPRGAGESTPLECLGTQALDALVASDPDPDTKAEMRASQAGIRGLGEGCLRRTGDLTRHVSTAEAARDMDVLRAALGQDRMAYFGASYGTLLGATYADLFPERVGRMVLDGAIDPTLSVVDTGLIQAEGFQTALNSYVDHCLSAAPCYLGADRDAALTTIETLLTRLDAKPIPGDATRELTEGLAVLGIWAPLYNRKSWPALDIGLGRALQGDGSALLSFADQYLDRGPNGYTSNLVEILNAVNCLDIDQWVAPRRLEEYEPEFVEASRTFGRVFAAGLTTCRAWPVHSGNKPAPLHATGSDPIMVVGTTRDPATPMAEAESLAAQLDDAVLVRRDGDGHLAYTSGNKCVDDTVERYLVSGVVPSGTTDC